MGVVHAEFISASDQINVLCVMCYETLKWVQGDTTRGTKPSSKESTKENGGSNHEKKKD